MQEVATVFWQILPVLITISIPILLLLAKWISSKIGAKLDIENKAKMQEFLAGVVVQGVAYAEQLAKQKANENQKINGESKLYIATQYIIEELKKQKIFDLTSTEIQKRIEIVLGIDTLTANATSNVLLKTEGGINEDGSIGFTG